MRIVRKAARIARNVALFGVDFVLPAFGIPRPWNYLAALLWLFWMGNLSYMIAIR